MREPSLIKLLLLEVGNYSIKKYLNVTGRTFPKRPLKEKLIVQWDIYCIF